MTAPGPRVRRRRHDPAAAEPIVPAGLSTVDLHTHSLRSDGLLEPLELIRAAAASGITTFAVTDHDNLVGYREIVAASAVPPGMALIPGVEINALVTRDLGLWEGELHILGFGVDPGDEEFEAILGLQRERRRIRFDRTVGRLRELGLSIDPQVAALAGGEDAALGRPTLARALVAAGHATSVEDAFRRLLGHGCPAYVPREGLGPVEAITAIRSAAGLATLAHFSEAPERTDVIRDLMGVGLAGLEVYHRSFDATTVDAVSAVAVSLGLTPTGGSDYHGDSGSYAEIHAGLWVPPEVAATVQARIESATRST